MLKTNDITLRWILNACFSIQSDNIKIIFDPWGSPTASIGSWFQSRRLTPDLLALIFEESYDAVVVTHHHTDHFDHRTLNEILIRNKKTKVFFSEASIWILKHPIEALTARFGSDRIRILPQAKPVEIGPFAITSFRVDFCDPLLCGQLMGCTNPTIRTQGIDSFVNIEIHGTRILNFNDCLVRLINPHISKIIDSADVVMGLFGAAGPFPQCFPELRNDQELRMSTTNRFIDDLTQIANTVNAKFVFPFSGQYLLGGSLSNLNEFKAVVPINEAVNRIQRNSQGKLKAVSLYPGAEWLIPRKLSHTLNRDLAIEVSRRFEEPNSSEQMNYLKEISIQLFPYQKIPLSRIKEDRMLQLLDKASSRYLRSVKEAGVTDKHTLVFEIEGFDYDYKIEISKNLSASAVKKDLPMDSGTTKMKIDSRLLYSMINRKEGYRGYTSIHWTNVHGGSHLEYRQSGYSAAALYFLNYFHT